MSVLLADEFAVFSASPISIPNNNIFTVSLTPGLLADIISLLLSDDMNENKYTPTNKTSISIVKNAAVIALFIITDFFSFFLSFFFNSSCSLGLNFLTLRLALLFLLLPLAPATFSSLTLQNLIINLNTNYYILNNF